VAGRGEDLVGGQVDVIAMEDFGDRPPLGRDAPLTRPEALEQ
jgi:hypothetical protein